MYHPAPQGVGAIASEHRTRLKYLRRIAQGGMAELYLGEATTGDITRQVALKRLLPEHAADPVRVAMFQEEARLAASLQHPSIVHTLDVVRSGDEAVLVLEFLDGTDLQRFRRRLPEDRRLPLEHTLLIAGSVLRALAYAHDRHLVTGGYPIVHQDVSPQNIFLGRDGGVKLLDFGIARAGDDEGGTDMLAGKVLYMSPEQCGGGEVDARTDVYGLGVVLYQLLTGNVPFRAGDAWQTMRAIIEKPAPRPRLLNPDLPAELEDIVLKALEKKLDDRWSSATEMLEALEDLGRKAGLYASTLAFSRFVEQTLGPRRAAASPDAPPDLDLAPAELEPLPASIASVKQPRLTLAFGDLPEEIAPLVAHLEGLAGAAKALELQGVPLPLAEAISRSQPLRPVARIHSVSIATRCVHCKETGTASVPMGRVKMRGPDAVRLSQPCERCGGALEVTSPLDELRAAATSPASIVHSEAPGCLARAGTAALVLMTLLAR